MAKYKVKHTSILHNKRTYGEGSTVELTEEQAKRLEDFVELIPEKPQTKTETKQSAKSSAKTETKDETVKDNNDGGKTDGK